MDNFNIEPIESRYKSFLKSYFNEKIEIESGFMQRTIENAAKLKDNLLNDFFVKYCEKLPEDVCPNYLKQAGYTFMKDKDGIMWFEKYGVRYSPKFILKNNIDTSKKDSILYVESIEIVEI